MTDVERIERPSDDCSPEVLDRWIDQVLDRIVNPADRERFLKHERQRLLTAAWLNGEDV